MSKEEILDLFKDLKNEIHINGLSIEHLRDYIDTVSEDVQGAHRHIGKIETRLENSRFID